MHKETFLKRAVNQCSRLMLHMMTISWLSTVFLLSETLFCMSSPIACFPLPQVPSSLVFSCNKALKYTAYTILFCFLTLSLVSSLPHICIFNTQNFKSGSNSLEVNIKPFNLLPQGESLLAAQMQLHANTDANASLPLQQNNWYSNSHPPNTIYLSRCNKIFNMLLLYVRTCFIHSNLLSVSLNQHSTLQLDSFPRNYPNICLGNTTKVKYYALDINHDRIRP